MQNDDMKNSIKFVSKEMQIMVEIDYKNKNIYFYNECLDKSIDNSSKRILIGCSLELSKILNDYFKEDIAEFGVKINTEQPQEVFAHNESLLKEYKLAGNIFKFTSLIGFVGITFKSIELYTGTATPNINYGLIILCSIILFLGLMGLIPTSGRYLRVSRDSEIDKQYLIQTQELDSTEVTLLKEINTSLNALTEQTNTNKPKSKIS